MYWINVQRIVFDNQCDQMARLFLQYLTNLGTSIKNLPNGINNLPKLAQNVAQYLKANKK